MFRVLFNHILPFVVGSVCGVIAFYALTPWDVPDPQNTTFTIISGPGSGSASCHGPGTTNDPGWGWEAPDLRGETTKVRITSMPRATYTEAARRNETEGTVLLRVKLLASGRVGPIETLEVLPNGLTERAIAAARQIKFEPKKINGKPVSTNVELEYSFEIH